MYQPYKWALDDAYFYNWKGDYKRADRIIRRLIETIVKEEYNGKGQQTPSLSQTEAS